MADDTIVTLDLGTVTLGEMSEVELASGRSFDSLLMAGRATRKLVALFLHESRSSAQPRSWRELSSLHLSDVPSSTSPSRSAGRRKASPRSRSGTSST